VLDAIMSCEQASTRASLAADEPLPPFERLLLGAHLMMCARCVNFSRNLAFLRRAARELPDALDKYDGDG